MSVVGLRSQARSDAHLERCAVTLLDAFFGAAASALDGRLHPAFSWFGRAVAPAELSSARLGRLAAAGRYTPSRARALPAAFVGRWIDESEEIVPRGTRALVLVDLAPHDGDRDAITVALSFAGVDEGARLLAVFDASALVPHLRPPALDRTCSP